ncbi:hypothetical protein J5N97_015846 [Dioscorea zingiberensis]|uniref:Uncharacterized protein n=1 Tax=Dioscorea zingiberensis TaxID=325984 RepID=A0A9D5CIB0_9LILI|nr:hypothetical protein J5N97_015846 [Dioscorea zingiberensis]
MLVKRFQNSSFLQGSLRTFSALIFFLKVLSCMHSSDLSVLSDLSPSLSCLPNMGRRPHALLLPYPAQGHVLPLMELAHRMVSHGFTITFINTHFNHARLLSAMPTLTCNSTNPSINFISIPDGLQPGDDRNHIANLCKALTTIMPLHLEELIIKMMHEQPEHYKPTCLIADESMAWAFDVAKKTGLRTAAFWPASATTFTNMRNIPKLIQDGIIHEHDGSAKTPGVIFRLSHGIPPMNVDHLSWNCFFNPESNKVIFHYVYSNSGVNQERRVCRRQLILRS